MLHHPMNAMSHDIPNVIGVDQSKVGEKIGSLVDGYMPMGEKGMHEMLDMNMRGPENTLPMMAGTGQFGGIGMGGMFTMFKIRNGITTYDDPGPYKNPRGTVAGPAGESRRKSDAKNTHTCPMHPEVVQAGPGTCPKCGMRLVPQK
jgi:hypothetical protein